MTTRLRFRQTPILMVFLVPVFLALPLRASDLPPAAQKALYEAGQAMEKGDHATAEEILTLFRQNQADVPHHLVEFALGNALAMQGRPKDALPHYRRCTELEPGYAPAWQNLGKTALDLGDHLQAGQGLARTYELGGGTDHDLLFNSCLAFVLAGSPQEALSGLERLTSGAVGKPKIQWMEILLKVHLDLGQEKKAIITLERMLADDGDNADLWKLLAQIRIRQNEYRKSLAAWEIYAGLGRPSPEELVLMGDLYMALGVPAKAAHNFAQALEHKQCPRLREKLVEAHLASRDPAKAASSARLFIDLTPTSRLWLTLGRALFEQGEYDEALLAFEQSGRLDPKDGKAHIMRGHCALRLKNREAAMAALEQARRFPAQRDQAVALLRIAATL